MYNKKIRAQLKTIMMLVRWYTTPWAGALPLTQSSVNAVSTRLLEKTQELNAVHMENDRCQSTLTMMEGKLRAVETTSRAKLASQEAELAQLQDNIRQYESLLVEYKGQLESNRLEVESRGRELRHREEEVERVRQEGVLELEKVSTHTTQYLLSTVLSLAEIP